MCTRSIHRFPLVVFAASIVCVLVTNCKGEESGSLQVSFQLGSGKSCGEFDIERVEAVLTNNDSDYDETVNCDKGEIRFNDVEPGTYDLRLFGYDSNSAAVKSSILQEATIKAGETTMIEKPIPLLDAPAKLKIRWDFEFSDCETEGIGGFHVTAFSGGGSDILFENRDIACDSKPDDDDGKYHTVPDEDRDLKGDDFGEVTIQPYDVNSADLGDAINFSFDNPGPGGEIKLSLSCGDTGCIGSGKPDDD